MGELYPFSAFYIMDWLKMQIPLVESRLALLYSSWFSDWEFAFLVRDFSCALFIFIGKLFVRIIYLGRE